jgi:hypothetical protein
MDPSGRTYVTINAPVGRGHTYMLHKNMSHVRVMVAPRANPAASQPPVRGDLDLFVAMALARPGQVAMSCSGQAAGPVATP